MLILLQLKNYIGKKLKNNMKKRNGFTLIELLIVVAIVTIMGSIAIPYYNEYVMRSKMVFAVNSLVQMQQKMEQYYQENKTFNGNGIYSSAWDFAVANLKIGSSSDKYSQIASLTSGSSTSDSYILNAGDTNTTNGFSFSLVRGDNGEVKRQTWLLPSGWPQAVAPNEIIKDCWVVSKNGECFGD